MHDINESKARLRECFRAVFPEASDAQIEAATTDNTEAWDSVAQVTLVSVVEEEFGIGVPAEKYEELISFDAYLKLVTPE